MKIKKSIASELSSVNPFFLMIKLSMNTVRTERNRKSPYLAKRNKLRGSKFTFKTATMKIMATNIESNKKLIGFVLLKKLAIMMIFFNFAAQIMVSSHFHKNKLM
jgi:hypothetical protein